MIEALNFKRLQEEVHDRYEYNEQCIVGIIFARYDLQHVQRIIEENYLYWNYNTKRYLDIFWAGYGEYLCPNDESATKKILKSEGNDTRIYYDLESFISVKEQFNHYLKDKDKYKDKLQLVLVNYKKGKLRFDKYISIDLEQNLDDNYKKIREIFEYITNACRNLHDVVELKERMEKDKAKRWIKGITISNVSDVINVAKTVGGILMKRNFIIGVITGALVFGTVGVFAGQYIATENTFPIKLNNNNVNLNGYNVDGSTYFKLRDIADVVGGFNVDFKNNTIRLSKDGYVYEDKNEDLIPTMSENQRYMINIFLSNFSEIDFNDYDANTASRDQLIYFGCKHNSVNHTSGAIPISDEEAAKYVTLDDFIHACYKTDEETVSNSIDRYLGKKVQHGEAKYNVMGYDWQFGYDNGYYYYDSGEEGDARRVFSIADNMYDNGDGTYTVIFTNYSSGYTDILNDCYNLTSESIEGFGIKVNKGATGKAVVRPYNYNGKDTYQLISLNMQE